MLTQDLVEAFGANRLLTYASAVAFRILVALIPLALLGIALVGALGQQHSGRTRSGRRSSTACFRRCGPA